MKLSPHFDREEFTCKCSECNFDTVDVVLLQVLEHIRLKYNSPVRINSGCRCPVHNKAVGGSKNSQHLYGRAADIVVDGVKAVDVYAWLDETYSRRYGMGKYNTFTHIDTRNFKARWGDGS